MASNNPIAPKDFTHPNITDALYATLEDGQGDSGKTYLSKDNAFNGYVTENGCRVDGFRSNMAYTAPELQQRRFWNGNPGKWKGMCELLGLFGGPSTRTLFNEISAHYTWRKENIGDKSGFAKTDRLVLAGGFEYSLKEKN